MREYLSRRKLLHCRAEYLAKMNEWKNVENGEKRVQGGIKKKRMN